MEIIFNPSGSSRSICERDMNGGGALKTWWDHKLLDQGDLLVSVGVWCHDFHNCTLDYSVTASLKTAQSEYTQMVNKNQEIAKRDEHQQSCTSNGGCTCFPCINGCSSLPCSVSCYQRNAICKLGFGCFCQ